MGLTAVATAPAGDPATYRVLGGHSRQALLAAVLRAGRPMDAGEAAAAVGLHRNTARVQMDVLCSVGLLRRRPEERSIRGRPRVLYEATAAAPEVLGAARSRAGEASYRELAWLLARQLAELADVPDEAIRAGRRWAATLDEQPLPARRLSAGQAAAVVTDVLGRLGFDPEPDLDGDRILLHRCPFAEVARENRAVVCGIHLGMLKATAERLDAPLRVVGLDPFVVAEPSLCIVRLATPGAARKRSRPPKETS
ncbi:MAG TPA: hypothetical protein VN840_14530 [Streptosporangiaceae bacterium]|nr:hypothetical protein [Streptosporangiaceae bacterium]